MVVRDNKTPDKPLEKLNGIGALVKMVPLYESQLKVVSTDDNITSDTYGEPTMYQYSTGVGNGNENSAASFSIHPSRVIIASEGADDGSIYGISALESPYNALMDLRKIIGSGAEGFYRNVAQSMVFDLKDGASAKSNASLLDKFNENLNDFLRNRFNRAIWTPGLEAKTLTANLPQPKEYFDIALNDVAASAQIPATILIGQQTGRLASGEDSKQVLAMAQSRRTNFLTELVNNTIDWFIKYGILPASKYEVEWTDLLASSDNQKLDNAKALSAINESVFKSGGGLPFSGEEIREAAGYELEDMPEGEGIHDIEGKPEGDAVE
jgi:hypothetical protein